MADVKLTKQDRFSVAWRHQFLQGSWNYERMQNGGWCYAIIPAIKRLYPNKEDQKAALKRHLEFYNTHPYVSAPVMGVTLALEEERANGAPVDDTTIQGVKVGMMGPLAGVGDPVFWFTARPILGALGASMAMSGSIAGPILFFVVYRGIAVFVFGIRGDVRAVQLQSICVRIVAHFAVSKHIVPVRNHHKCAAYPERISL